MPQIPARHPNQEKLTLLDGTLVREQESLPALLQDLFGRSQ